MKKTARMFILLSVLLPGRNGMAQLPDGSTAPDFTLSDINGNEHTLYGYLDQGKTVYIDFFACHCPYCWNYHNTHALVDLHTLHGPGTASDDVVVVAIELDAGNGPDQFYGISGNTQGNWVTGTNYPQINPEGNDLTTIVNAYAVNYYPLIYAICPDRTITAIGTRNAQLLYEHTSTCGSLGIADPEKTVGPVRVSQHGEELLVAIADESLLQEGRIELIDVTGKVVASVTPDQLQFTIATDSIAKGFYILAVLRDRQVLFSTTIQKN